MLGRARLYLELVKEDSLKSETIRHLQQAKEEIDNAIKYFEETEGDYKRVT
jgi:hypothetical protein